MNTNDQLTIQDLIRIYKGGIETPSTPAKRPMYKAGMLYIARGVETVINAALWLLSLVLFFIPVLVVSIFHTLKKSIGFLAVVLGSVGAILLSSMYGLYIFTKSEGTLFAQMFKTPNAQVQECIFWTVFAPGIATMCIVFVYYIAHTFTNVVVKIKKLVDPNTEALGERPVGTERPGVVTQAAQARKQEGREKAFSMALTATSLLFQYTMFYAVALPFFISLVQEYYTKEHTLLSTYSLPVLALVQVLCLCAPVWIVCRVFMKEEAEESPTTAGHRPSWSTILGYMLLIFLLSLSLLITAEFVSICVVHKDASKSKLLQSLAKFFFKGDSIGSIFMENDPKAKKAFALPALEQ
ncbi:hypothetical protein NECID01_0375 [Nematocida sp. AWRm77]|nr:hypothetical protein NECID01_0375 [Nematocida sp. AWRm77]